MTQIHLKVKPQSCYYSQELIDSEWLCLFESRLWVKYNCLIIYSTWNYWNARDFLWRGKKKIHSETELIIYQLKWYSPTSIISLSL